MGFWHCVFILCEVISLSPYLCIAILLLCLLKTNNLVLRLLINLHWVFVSSGIASSRSSRHLIPSPYKCSIINIFCLQGCKQFQIFLAFSNKFLKSSFWLLGYYLFCDLFPIFKTLFSSTSCSRPSSSPSLLPLFRCPLFTPVVAPIFTICCPLFFTPFAALFFTFVAANYPFCWLPSFVIIFSLFLHFFAAFFTVVRSFFPLFLIHFSPLFAPFYPLLLSHFACKIFAS